MDKLSYLRIVIQQAVWLYFRFALSYRDVEDMLAERGIDVSYETVRRWALKFGTIIARKLRRGRPRPDGRWHLDEVFVSVNGKQLYVWRAVDSEGEVLDILVQPRRDRQAALKLMRKLLKKQGIAPATIVTDKLRSYGSALRELGVAWRHAALARCVLYNRDTRFAHLLLALLKREDGLVVGDNEPYSVTDASDYTIPMHGERRGLHGRRLTEDSVRRVDEPRDEIPAGKRGERKLTAAWRSPSSQKLGLFPARRQRGTEWRT